MLNSDWTLSKLIDALETSDPGALLVFDTPDGSAGNGYHVTELKRATISSIDCGVQLDDWTETQIQILDGSLGHRMETGKFVKIAKTSIAALPGLDNAPLTFEFSPRNKGLSRFQIQGIVKAF